jgi:hypothetical protein
MLAEFDPSRSSISAHYMALAECVSLTQPLMTAANVDYISGIKDQQLIATLYIDHARINTDNPLEAYTDPDFYLVFRTIKNGIHRFPHQRNHFSRQLTTQPEFSNIPEIALVPYGIFRYIEEKKRLSEIYQQEGKGSNLEPLALDEISKAEFRSDPMSLWKYNMHITKNAGTEVVYLHPSEDQLLTVSTHGARQLVKQSRNLAIDTPCIAIDLVRSKNDSVMIANMSDSYMHEITYMGS